MRFVVLAIVGRTMAAIVGIRALRLLLFLEVMSEPLRGRDVSWL